MIRRNVLIAEWDYRAVKWSLIASACALMLGAFAENRLEVHAQQLAPEAECPSVRAALPAAPDAPMPPIALRVPS